MTSGEDNNDKLVSLQKLIIIELWANQQSNGKLIAVMKNLGFLNPKERWLTNLILSFISSKALLENPSLVQANRPERSFLSRYANSMIGWR